MNIGLGDREFSFAVYIANKPNMIEYQHLSRVIGLSKGEIDVINQSCGNGWRKVFNVYAKLLFSLDSEVFGFSKKAPTWQGYRDKYLLQDGNETALLFSPPQLTPNKDRVHIISGKGHAKALVDSGKLVADLVWLDDEFAIDKQKNLIVCPYFDYRQLSNIKIAKLAELLSILKVD